MTEASIREELCGEMFESQVARDLWIKRREILTMAYGGLSPFYQLVNNEFERTQSAPMDGAKATGSEAMDEADLRSCRRPTQ